MESQCYWHQLLLATFAFSNSLINFVFLNFQIHWSHVCIIDFICHRSLSCHILLMPTSNYEHLTFFQRTSTKWWLLLATTACLLLVILHAKKIYIQCNYLCAMKYSVITCANSDKCLKIAAQISFKQPCNHLYYTHLTSLIRHQRIHTRIQ